MMFNNVSVEYVFMYFLTLFTFIIIALFLLIKNKLTYFERQKWKHSRSPNVLFGHFYPVVSRQSAFFYHVWKYYNYFKRKQFKCGGLFVFLRPAILLVDKELIEKVLEEREKFVDVMEPHAKFEFDADLSVLDGLLRNIGQIGDCFGENKMKISERCHKFILDCILKLVGLENVAENREAVKQLREMFEFKTFPLFASCYPFFDRNLRRELKLKRVLKEAVNKRKKEDIRKDDLLQLFIDSKLEIDGFVEFIGSVLCSSYGSVLFSLQELCAQKDIQHELIGELRRFKNEDKELNFEALESLSFLNTVVKETFRKYPPKSVLFKKTLTSLSLDRNTVLPKDSFVLLSIYGIQHDVSNYPNPETFDPDRFAEENEKFVKPNAFLPFGIDSRRSEMKLSELLIKLTLSRIFLKYKINLPENCSKILEFNKRTTNAFPNEEIQLELNQL